MKKWLITLLAILLLITAGYVIIFQLVVPGAARAFIPFRWQNVPLGESKAMVHEYLGEPASVKNGKDHWEQRINPTKKYLLDIEYRGDTISASYQVNYAVTILGLNHVTKVKSGKLKR